MGPPTLPVRHILHCLQGQTQLAKANSVCALLAKWENLINGSTKSVNLETLPQSMLLLLVCLCFQR